MKKHDTFTTSGIVKWITTWSEMRSSGDFDCKNLVLLQSGDGISRKWNRRCNRHRSHANTEIETCDSTLRADRLTEKCPTAHPEAPIHNSHATCLILPGLRWVFEFEVSVPKNIMNCQPALQTLQIQPYVYCMFLRYNPSSEKQSTNGEFYLT